MPDYKTIYLQLMGDVAEAIDLLIAAIRRAEDAYCAAAAPQMALSAKEEPDETPSQPMEVY